MKARGNTYEKLNMYGYTVSTLCNVRIVMHGYE